MGALSATQTTGAEQALFGKHTAAYLAQGLTIATLLRVISPTSSQGQVFSDNTTLILARSCLFLALVVTSAVLLTRNRHIDGVSARPKCIVGLVLLQLLLSPVYPCVLAGILPDWFLTLDFIIQGIVFPVLLIAWGEMYARLSAIRVRLLSAVSLLLAAVWLFVWQVLPSGLFSQLFSFLMVPAPLCILWLRKHTAPVSYHQSPHILNTLKPSWRLFAGMFCALATANELSGSAETGQFISFYAIIAAPALAALLLLAAHVCLEKLGSSRQGYAARGLTLSKINLCVIALIAVGYAAAGLTMPYAGAALAYLEAFQHYSLTALEIFVCTMLWLMVLDIVRTTQLNPLGPLALGALVVFAGKAVGFVVGVLMPLDPAALSIVALVLFVPGFVLLAFDALLPGLISKDTKTSDALDTAPLAAMYNLTPREKEVLALWVQGTSLDQVAEELCISKNTAKTHVAHIYQKTNTANRSELIGLVVRQH